MDSYSDFEKIIKGDEFEGEILHMYQDSRGNVTVGVGILLSDTEAAQRLPFVVRLTRKTATREEIKADFDKVKNAPTGYKAVNYKKYTSLELQSSDSSTLLKKRIGTFVRELRHGFPEFNDMPRPAQLGLLDLAFNCGTAKVVTRFPNFKKAIQKGDYAKAAIEAHRTGIGNKRNETVKNWFLEAQDEENKAKNRKIMP
jgi:GH24 family phage-related lysozyme (muramidase)